MFRLIILNGVSDMKEIYIFNIKNKEVNGDTYERLLNFVSDEKRARIGRFRIYEDKLRSLFGEAVAKNELSKKLKCDIKDIEFEKNKYGKLKVKGNNDIYFNISHSGDYAIVGISDSEIGIDIEIYKGAKHEVVDLAKRYYTEDEYNWILSFDEAERIKAFYKIWTLKESYVKFVGKGLSISLSSFTFAFDGSNISLKKDNEVFNDVQFKTYDIEDSYMMSICYKGGCCSEQVEVKNITLEQLKEDLKIE